jgi:hypothetical protein
MKPDPSKHDPSPEYLRSLLANSGLSQRAAAERIGIPERSMRYYLTAPGTAKRWAAAPYPVQFALEQLVK